jgi:hypothetical protein
MFQWFSQAAQDAAQWASENADMATRTAGQWVWENKDNFIDAAAYTAAGALCGAAVGTAALVTVGGVGVAVAGTAFAAPMILVGSGAGAAIGLAFSLGGWRNRGEEPPPGQPALI